MMFALELLRHFQESPLPPFVSRTVAVILVLAGSVVSALDAAPAKPLSDGDLLALVAGGALPENIVNEIKSRGLAFHPGDQYRAQLETAGAESTILTALNMAKISVSVESSDDHVEFLQHLAQAGRLMRNRRYTEAVRELNAALAANPESVSVGFVMGDLLREQERWMPAASVYGEVLNRNPDFPEVHTKLAFISYSLGDSDRAITEATAALKRTPDNAEAHKNMGLAWGEGRHFEAAMSEYREALRIKPDYAAVHYDLGILYDDGKDVEAAISEYKKSIALEPGNARYHNNLAGAFRNKGDRDGAIREYREAKRLDPDDLNVRNNLAGTLIDRDVDAAILEFRELVAIAPRFELCRLALGMLCIGKEIFLRPLNNTRGRWRSIRRIRMRIAAWAWYSRSSRN
jgi:tetratricopeptide (TPR) repeat protein